MIYKILPKINAEDTQKYARIDDDGLCRLVCEAEYSEFKLWIEEGNTPQPADEGA